jgi:hypothetical protein
MQCYSGEIIMKILFPIIENGVNVGVAIMSPSAKCGLTVEQIAQKDVPYNVPYKIVEDSVVPTDRTFRDAWEINADDCDTGVGADFGEGSSNLPPADWFPQDEVPEGVPE